MDLVYPHIPQPTQSENDDALAAATQYCFENGVTSIHHMTEPSNRNRGGVGEDIRVFESAHKRSKLKIR